MEDILREHIANIIDCSQALLREEEGELNVKQRRGIRSIISNAEVLVHLVTEFLAVPLNEVTADLRHELANPLTPIRGYSELLSMGMMGVLNEQQQFYAHGLYESADSLRLMVEEMVNDARRQAGVPPRPIA